MIKPENIKPFYKVLDRIRCSAIVVLFAFIVVSMALQIALRAFRLPMLDWTDEILRYINIWVVFLGAGIAVKHSTHLRLNFFVDRFVPKDRRVAIERIRSVIIIACLAVIVVFGVTKTISSMTINAQNIKMSMAWFYLAIPVGTALMIVDYLLILIYGGHPFIERELREDESC